MLVSNYRMEHKPCSIIMLCPTRHEHKNFLDEGTILVVHTRVQLHVGFPHLLIIKPIMWETFPKDKTKEKLARANQPVLWFLGGKGLGNQQGTSEWVSSPKSEEVLDTGAPIPHNKIMRPLLWRNHAQLQQTFSLH